ncbi:hypothetical protein [Bradyrhizobium manausense]|uniref:Uncharacterized protein n=1 Tax=Bradyrhizobium manausense TaxID=989370 RepID=A0A0R3D0S1_9BRAD|nr:hypothetical protein [Bradyrhizobium manausense]KRQ03265.1 hypothetical protein AOQ71_31550 [Bradyrhizobium manausense]
MTAYAEAAVKFAQYRREKSAPLTKRRPLTTEQFAYRDALAEAARADLQQREAAAAQREAARDQRGDALPVAIVEDRSTVVRELPPVSDFVLEVFGCIPAWEHAPTFCHARYVQALRASAKLAEDPHASALYAADALALALSPVARMHSEWNVLHTAACRLVVRLQGDFGDGEDDFGSLQRLQRKLLQISAVIISAEIIEQRGLFSSAHSPALVSLPASKPASPAQRHADRLRAAVERGEVKWIGEPPPECVRPPRDAAPGAPRLLSPRAARMTIDRLTEAGVPIPPELAAMARGGAED